MEISSDEDEEEMNADREQEAMAEAMVSLGEEGGGCDLGEPRLR